MSFRTVKFTLGADVTNAGTFTIPYPAGTNAGDYSNAVGHYISINGTRFNQPENITLAFGAASVTVTNTSGGTIPAGSSGAITLNRAGRTTAIKGRNGVYRNLVQRVNDVELIQINLGSPVAGGAATIAASQAVTVGTTPLMVLNGSIVAVGGVITLDVPRNVVGAWTNTAVMTVTGTDEYGRPMVESSASGTSMTGVKAFKTISSISFSANVTGATAGTGNVLGLPLHIPKSTTGYILKELQDDAVATAGTVVAGLTKNTPSTATTADVRGTYTPNATPNGTISFALLAVVADAEYQGNPQFAG